MSQKTLNLCLERYNFVKFGETTKSTHTVLCTNNAHNVNSDKYRLTPAAVASKHGEGYVFTLNYDFDRPLFTIVQKSYSIDGTSGKIVFEGIDPISKAGSKYLRRVEVSPVKLSDGSYLLEVTKDEYLRIGTTGAALGDEDLESLNEKIVATGGIKKSVETVGGKQVLKLDASGSAGAKEIVYFDVDPSDPPSGIYAAITEALSKEKEPVLKIDGAVYFYTTGTDKYVFVGGYTKEAVGYTEIEVSDDDSVTSKSVDDKVYNMYILSQDDPASPGETPSDEDQWVCDADKHVITKDELVAAHADCRYFILNNAVEPDSNSRKYFASVTVISNSYIRLRFYMMQYDAQGVAEFYQKTVAADSEGRLYILSSYSATLAGTIQAVLVSEPQSFDSVQKAQGRDNIGAASASDVAALQSQVSSLSDVSAYSVKGEATVAQLNAGPSGIQAGWAYQLTDSGTLTAGSLAVVAGDTVAWDGTKWFPLVNSDYYVTKECLQMKGTSVAVGFSDANNAPIGSFVWCQASNLTANFPQSGDSFISGNLLTLSQKSTYGSQYVTQLYFTMGSKVYVRFKAYGGYWTEWKWIADSSDVASVNTALSAKILECVKMIGNYNDSGVSLTDANNAPNGSVIWCSGSNVANVPNSLSGNLFTISARSNRTNQYISQLYFVTSGKIYIRFKAYGGYWTDWGEVTLSSDLSSVNTSLTKKIQECLKMGGQAVNISLTDADNAPNGSIVWCLSENVAHLPTNKAGNLVTFSNKYSYDSQYVSQLYFTTETKAYIRFKKYDGTWSSWERFLNEGDLTPFNELRASLNYPSLSMFKRVGVIGDSYASAYLCDANGNVVGTFYDISWPQILGRKTGSTWVNFTRGGLSTRSWLTNQEYGLAKMESEDPCDLYVLVLGINDMAISGYMGTIADITSYESYTDYPDTFYGNYGKIFEQILAHAPGAKIVFSTMALNNNPNGTGTSGAYNAAIEEIAEHYNVPVIRQYSDSFFSSSIYTTMYGSHPTKAGQAGMATAIERLLQKCVSSNLTYFNSFEGLT